VKCAQVPQQSEESDRPIAKILGRARYRDCLIIRAFLIPRKQSSAILKDIRKSQEVTQFQLAKISRRQARRAINQGEKAEYFDAYYLQQIDFSRGE
jgi:hypothetical protein